MDKNTRLSKLIFSVSILIFSITVLVFVLKFSASDLQAVGIAHKNAGWINSVFTQSKDGKKLYEWKWSKNKWLRITWKGKMGR